MNNAGKKFRPDTDTVLLIFIFALAIFILGVQLGIREGKRLQIEEIQIQNGYYISD